MIRNPILLVGLVLGLFILGALTGVAFFLTAGPVEAPIATVEEEVQEEVVEIEEPEEVQVTEPLAVQAPDIVQGVYLTRWSVGIPSRVAYLKQLAGETGLNTIVIDVKDSLGVLTYDTELADAEAYQAHSQITVKDMEALLDDLHREGIYVVARIAVFEDSVLAHARPDLAIRSASDPEAIWLDNKGLAWTDPASREVWEYNARIAKDALGRGFDEVNFDYIRFPSDGNLQDLLYPVWDGQSTRREVIAEFFGFLRQELGDARMSADLFGLATVSTWDDLGIGQVLEDAFPYFDYVSPMVYPSHFALGFAGYERPDEYPYEVVHLSMKKGNDRLGSFKEQQKIDALFRPWLQYFDLNGSEAVYDASLVLIQIEAVKEALGEGYAGFLLWHPWNVYPEEEMRIIFPPL